MTLAAPALAIDDGSGLAEQRERFVEGLDAVAAGDDAAAAAALAELGDYPLHDWLLHEQLSARWQRATPPADALASLAEFARSSDDAALTRRLASRLQRSLARAESWQRFLDVQASEHGIDMPCTTVRARWELGQLDGFDDASRALWIDPSQQSSICEDVIERFAADGPPDVAAIWERLYTAVDGNRFERAHELLGMLGSRDRAQVRGWLDAIEAPGEYLNTQAPTTDTPLARRIVADLVLRWSREDTEAAIDWWHENSERYTFFRDRHYDTHRALVMRAALRRMPRAYEWLETFEPRADDLEILEWRVRAALLDADWLQVMKSLYRLPEEEREEDHWAYWEARALDVAGHTEPAREIYERLADLQSWHGFLAADRLGREYRLVDEPIEVDAQALQQLADDSRLIRSREFAAVGLDTESRRVWNSVIGQASGEPLLASAVLAKAWGLDDRAIFSAGKADARRALSYRFPVLYRSEVAQAATTHRIEPAWIFGVMRRESAFIPDVVSSAGAVGLMQLMPRTADYVAELQHASDWGGDLTRTDVNIDFGTFYLNHVLERFDGHKALATASYNAGPTRVSSWLPEQTMEADRWIDTIPFTETRRYVRAVLAYAAIYEHQLTGSAQRLSSKLPPVAAAPLDDG